MAAMVTPPGAEAFDNHPTHYERQVCVVKSREYHCFYYLLVQRCGTEPLETTSDTRDRVALMSMHYGAIIVGIGGVLRQEARGTRLPT
jgi:hypothetical protein